VDVGHYSGRVSTGRGDVISKFISVNLLGRRVTVIIAEGDLQEELKGHSFVYGDRGQPIIKLRKVFELLGLEWRRERRI
jgi:hypothetical protein